MTGQAAVHLARFADRVTIAVRRPHLAETMSAYLVNEIAVNRRITVAGCTEVTDGGGDGRLSWLTLTDTEDTRRKQVDLTPAALAYFDELSGLLVKAAEGR